MDQGGRRRRAPRPVAIAVAGLIVAAVALVYGQLRGHGFINYDDAEYITGNPLVTGGFSAAGLRAAFGVHAANWHPLTWISHMADWSLFGAWAGGHHLVSVALHAANAVLLLALLRALTGSFWRSAAVAAVFALHPLRVESVAWASERKDVLSSLLWLLATLAYVRQVRRPARGGLAGVAALLALGLAAKPMLVTLPLTLLLLDWWPLGRAGAGGRPGTAGGASPWPGLVAEKWPLFLLALAAGLGTLWAQTTTTVPFVRPALATRFANAVVSCALYLRDLVWPARLAFLYPYPRNGVPGASVAAAALLLAAVTAAAAWQRRRRPWLLAGWAWYLVTLLPVAGLVQVGAQARSDRYTYLTLVGVTVALVWLAADLAGPRPAPRAALAAALCGALAASSVASWRYAGAWRDSLSLMTSAAAATRGNFVVLNNLGGALIAAGRAREALPVLEEAVRVNPAHCNARYNLGAALMALGRDGDAHGALTAALACYRGERYRPFLIADTEANLGTVSLALGRPAEAERHFREALAIAADPNARLGLAEALARQRAARGAPAPKR